MTLWTVLNASIARTLIVATLAAWLSRGVFRQTRAADTAGIRRVRLIAALLPLLVPELIVGFTYRLTAQQLTHSVVATECLYGMLLLVRAVSVGVLVRLILPAGSVSGESLHAWSLLKTQRLPGWRITWWRLLVTGPWRADLVAWCLAALTVFQDFETAALVQVDRHPIVWTVWLFDANAGNQILSHSLRMLIAPLMFQLLLMVPVMWLVSRRSTGIDRRSADHTAARAGTTWPWIACPMFGVMLVVIWPVIRAIPELRPGGMIVMKDPVAQLKQQASGLGFAVAAASVALLTAVMLRRQNSRLFTAVCLFPGLCGSLMLSLVLLAFFQLPGVRTVWDTWLPMLIGQALLMLPRAWLLVVILESRTSAESRHSSRLLLAGSVTQRRFGEQLQWRLEHLGWLLCVFLLTHWCSWDVTTASILRPVSVEPVVTRLYREMHFSRTESLSVLALITVLTPALAALAAGSLWRTRRLWKLRTSR